MTEPSRRRFLAAAGATSAILVAGCPGDDESAGSPTPTDRGTQTPEPTTSTAGTSTGEGTAAPEARFDCAAAERPEPDGPGEGDVAPLDYPERPEGEPSVEWAAAYEEAYVRNSIIRQEQWAVTEWEEFSLADSRVAAHPRGTVLWLSVSYAFTHGDGKRFESRPQTAGYYVDDRGVLRLGISGELPEEVLAHPAVDGKTVECY